VIDRIDERDDGLVVIDYKTRAAPIPYRDAVSGRNIQLPLYMMAARDVVRGGERVAGGYYLHIHSRRRGSEFPSANHPELSVDAIAWSAANFVKQYAARVGGGDFPVRPNGPCPPYCEYNPMCRIQSLKWAEDDAGE
jgi:hypothetical protein